MTLQEKALNKLARMQNKIVPWSEDLNPRQIFKDYVDSWIQERKRQAEKNAKLKKLGYSSAIQWMAAQRRETGKDWETVKNEAIAMRIWRDKI